jgi:hypothetical protein
MIDISRRALCVPITAHEKSHRIGLTTSNGTKLRGIVVKRAACLPAKSVKFPIKRHLVQPLRRSNILNLVPLYAVPGIKCIRERI